MELKPDVEVKFEFIGNRKDNFYEGYRPAHLVKEDYLTTGVHHYYELEKESSNGIMGTITFITPCDYPECLWVGKKIEMYEGRSLIGYATIIKIFNTILQKNDE